MFKFDRFIPITKVDDEERMVYGWASTPDLDSDGEIISVEGLKKALPKYLQFPTLREMHQPKVAGTIKNSEIREGKGLYIGAKVVAEDAWKYVKEGVYRGFSIGGNVISKVGNIIEELDLVEISLVDVPANKKAMVEIWKKESAKTFEDMLKAETKEEISKVLESLSRVSLEDSTALMLREVVKINMAKKLEKQEDMETPEIEVEEPEVEEVDVPESSEEETVEETVETEEGEEVEDSEESEEAEEDAPEGEELEEETKETSATPELTKLDTIADKLGKLETKEVKVESPELIKMVDHLEKMVDIIEGFEKRLTKLESEPAPLKSKQAYVEIKRGEDIEKGNTEVDGDSELGKKLARMNELNGLYEKLGRHEFAKRGFSMEAGKLKDEIERLQS